MSETVGSLIAKLSKLKPESRVYIADGGKVFSDQDLKIEIVPEEIEEDGEVCHEFVTISLDDMFLEYWWVPDQLSKEDKLEWIEQILKADEPGTPRRKPTAIEMITRESLMVLENDLTFDKKLDEKLDSSTKSA